MSICIILKIAKQLVIAPVSSPFIVQLKAFRKSNTFLCSLRDPPLELVFRKWSGFSFIGGSQHFNRDTSQSYPLSVKNLLESQRLRFMEEALTEAQFTHEQQQRPKAVHEKLDVPGVQNPLRDCEGQEVLVDNFSTSDSGAAKMPTKGTSGIYTTANSPNVFNLAAHCYGFHYPVIEEEKGGGFDVDVSDNGDDTNVEQDDKKKQKLCHQ